MNFKNYLPLASAALLVGACSNSDTKPEKPNILLIVIDDLGWKDLQCYGNEFFETPNINKIAEEGVLFTNAYASCPVCSPTRASIMTGKYTTSVNITDYITGKQAHTGVLPCYKFIVPEFNFELKHEEITIPEMLKPDGYKTIHIGKWHLGGIGYYPTDQGFDINIAGHEAGMPASYYFPYCKKMNNGEEWCVQMIDRSTDKDSLYLTDRLTNEAINFISSNKDTSFFMYLPYYSVHTPIEGRQDLIDYYINKADTSKSLKKRARYAAMVHGVDENVGRIMGKLDELGISDNTIVILTSDNGGLKAPNIADNLPLRAGKGTMYEGGIRIPAIFKWNGHFSKGVTSDEMICSIDLFPTIMDILGLEDSTSEGVSILPVLERSQSLERETLYWHYPHYHRTTPVGGIRHKNFKLIEYFETGKLELYDLSSDISEKNDIAEQNPEKVKELHQMLKDWREETNAKMPTLNPNWDSTQVYKTQLK